MPSRILTIKDLNKTQDALDRKVCIFSQGFVGLPLALSFDLRGSDVVGVDVDESLVESANKGNTHHTERFHGVTIEKI